VEKAAKVRMRYPSSRLWQVLAGGKPAGWFVLDEVYGKHEFITYAVALDAGGRGARVEILDYRETHGGESATPNGARSSMARDTGRRSSWATTSRTSAAPPSPASTSAKAWRRVLAIHEVALRQP